MSPEDLVRILRDNPDLRAANGGQALAIVRGESPGDGERLAVGGQPTEEQEQAAVIAWARANEGAYPELAWLFHVPNGGARDAVTGAMLKRAGVQPGVPDLCLPCPRPRSDGGQWHGLWLEMKRADHSNNPTPEQKRWLDYLRSAGYMAVVCYGAEAAIQAIQTYLGGGQ